VGSTAATGVTAGEMRGGNMATYTGEFAANTLTSSISLDTISGWGGNDPLNGRGGVDTIYGRGGNDALPEGGGAAPPSAGPGAAPPPSATGPGFRVVLSDSFGAGYQTSNWGNPYGGGTYWNGAFSWSAADVAVRNGEMQVTMTHHADGSWTAGGFNSFKAGKSIRYGTVEFDARVEEAQGTMGAILMWPANDSWPPEIDILETPGQDVMHTLHWAGAGGSDQYASVRNQTYDETAWHHYKMTWLPNDLKIEVDGVERARWTQHVPDIAMGFGAQGLVGSPNDGWMGGAPDGGTPAVVTVHLDNVVMSQWEGAVA
jgi:Glycosyl hydrolases family 16